MYQKKVLPLFGQSQGFEPQTGYFVNEIFWNLLLRSQLEQAKQSTPTRSPKADSLPQTNP
ncbi:hypothetical protein NEA10_17345 [Phormidium yuhuli AB48]|uniref:Uncharacterized protein n=1 Tax=Phormidium yuhuli AB48 TaxID=2940671 RepID=A0ABY5ANJ0_9CYAN|nr:hypothetical protein [Phormidium yuhuli]USR90575.1 hypothetical protein NEA10_17345 [Phormidium yuhuli AB48]